MCMYDGTVTSNVHKAIARTTKTGTPFKGDIAYDLLKDDPLLSGVSCEDFKWTLDTLCGWRFFNKTKGTNEYTFTWEGLGFAKQNGWL